MKRKFLFLLFIFFILIASLCVVNATNPSSIKYDGFTYDLSGLELYSQTFAFYNSLEDKVVVVTAADNTLITAVEDYYTLANGDYKIYFFNKGANEVYKTITPSNNNTYRGNRTKDMIYSNFDILKGDRTVWFKATDKLKLELNISNSEPTTDLPIRISSQNFDINDFGVYKVYYSVGDVLDWKECHLVSVSDIQAGSTYYYYCLDVYRNGSYAFKLVNEKTGENDVVSVSILNIIYTQDNISNYINGVFKPTPFLSTEYISDTEILITTQKFFDYELNKLECSYAKDLKDLHDESAWKDVCVRGFSDVLTNETTFQYCLNVSNLENDGDGTYFFRFYNKDLNEYTYAGITVIFENIVDYHDSLSGVNADWAKLLDFFKERFGFLVYPFELIINVLDKMSNVEFEEPKFSIPDINEPVTNQRFISAVDFNFNDLLENDVFKNMHDIYLIIVDAIVIFALINLAKNKIMGVFEK